MNFRSYLVGAIGSGVGTGLLGAQELERTLSEKRARVLIITWNMCGLKEIPDKLEELVLPDKIESMPDIYAIGAQEFAFDE